MPSSPCISVPLRAPSTESERSISREPSLAPGHQLAAGAESEERLIQLRSTKATTTFTECTSSDSLGSPIFTSSPESYLSSALCNEHDDSTLVSDSEEASLHDGFYRPTRDDEESSTSASKRAKFAGKQKMTEGMQEAKIHSRSTTSGSWLKSKNKAINERKSPLPSKQSSISIEIVGPSTYEVESSSASYSSEDDSFGELSASVATVRPSTITDAPNSSAGSPIGEVSASVSAGTSPHSDQSYTLEVRPPSSIMATPDDEEEDTYDDLPTEPPRINSPQLRSILSPMSSSGSFASRPNSRRQNVVRVASPPELPPVPPVASIRARRPRPSNQAVPQSSLPSPRLSSLPDPRGSEYSRRSSWYRPAGSNNQSVEDGPSPWYRPRLQSVEEDNGQLTDRSMSTFRSPSLSPLPWNPTQGPTSVSTAGPPVPTEIPGLPITNPLLSTPRNFRPVSVRESESHTYPQSGTVPQRTTRFTVPLPSSPGSISRPPILNSPPFPGALSVESWGTPVTMAGEPLYNQTTSVPGEAGQWAELPLPHSTRPAWMPEGNGNPQWTSVDWPTWSDPTQLPQDAPIAVATPAPPYVAPPGYMLICSFCGTSAAGCVCRRYVRIPPVPTGTTSAGLRTPVRPPPAPHPRFWFADGTVTFEVEDVYFKVHKYFFERHSEQFRILLARRSGTSANIVPVRILDAKKLDFERLLKVFYPSNLANPDLATVEEWTSVLRLAVKWHMEEPISLAIQELTPITSAVDKISLAKKFGLFGYNFVPNSNYNRDWLLPALRELCGRNFPLRFEEARKLDMWTVIKVWEVQHEISNAGLNHNVSQIERLIKRRFGLE